MGVHVALLRGINVGGKHKLPMRRLAAIFEAAGCEDVGTYIQSGNVVFRAAAAAAKQVPELVQNAIVAEFGFASPVIIRNAAQLAKAVADNPFLSESRDPSLLSVAFLAARPGPAKVRSLDPERSRPDEFVVRGSEIFLYCPNGARSKLTNAYFDARLATTSTVRNWRTTRKLLELAGG